MRFECLFTITKNIYYKTDNSDLFQAVSLDFQYDFNRFNFDDVCV